MTEWLVWLQGHQFELAELADHFTSTDRNVGRDEDGHYYLRSSDFGQMTDPSAVRGALQIVEHMNGAMKLQSGGSYQAVEFDAVTEIDESGKRLDHVMLSVSAEARSRVAINLNVGDQDHTQGTPQPPSSAEVLSILADQDERVADALRFYERGDWINLYKAWEVVCDAAGGMHNVVKNGWAKEPDRSRFSGTAQSRTELGGEARHASEKYKAPKDPMTLDEARGFVGSVIRAWVATL